MDIASEKKHALETHLAQAEHHVPRGENNILRQKGLIERIRRLGDKAGLATELAMLTDFETLQRQFITTVTGLELP